MTAKRCGSAPHDGSDHLELLNPEVMFVDGVNSQTILKRMTRMLSHLNPVNSLKVGRTFRETQDWFFFVSHLAFIAINR